MDEHKPDPRMLLALLLIPLLTFAAAVARFRRKRRKARELAAARALARRLEAERRAGREEAKRPRGGKRGAGKAPGAPGSAEKRGKAGLLARRSSAYRKRLIRFVIMLGLERLIAARRARLEEEFSSDSLLRRFSKAKDL